MATYEVTPAGDGLDVTAIPKGFAAEVDREVTTVHHLPLGDDRFVAAEPDEGVHPQIAFLEDGRYLYATRPAPREES